MAMIIRTISAFFNDAAFWWLLIGGVFFAGKVVTPWGLLVEREKYQELNDALKEKLNAIGSRLTVEKFYLYCDRCLYVFSLRTDIYVLLVVGGAAFLKMVSMLLTFFMLLGGVLWKH